jgi:hypothetical protein
VDYTGGYSPEILMFKNGKKKSRWLMIFLLSMIEVDLHCLFAIIYKRKWNKMSDCGWKTAIFVIWRKREVV